MASNVGNQSVNVKFFDGVVNAKGNALGQSVRLPGIYTGGHLYKVNDTTVNVSALTCEIKDSGSTAFEQVYVQTGVGGSGTVPVTVSATNNLIILYWTYTGSASADYLQFLAIPAANLSSYPNALVVGLTNAANGAGWVGFVYTGRSNPNIHDLFLKVELSETLDSAPMSVRGQVNYGTTSYQIADQLTSTIVAPGSGSQIVLVQVNTSGVVVLTYGAISGSPSAPSYAGLVTLAQILITSGQTSIVQANITDTRAYVSGSVPPNTYVDLVSNQSVAGTKTFTGALVLPTVTSDPVSPVNGQIWLNTSY